MSRKKTNEEVMQLNIELADNGVIIRNPDNEDYVWLALRKEEGDEDERNAMITLSLGQMIYEWLIEVVLTKHEDELIINGFEIDISARCTGR